MYQNSGVTIESEIGGVNRRYYGRIEEIRKLDYMGGEYTVAMFRVRWAKNVDYEDHGLVTMTIPEAQPIGAKNVKGKRALGYG